MMDWQRAGLFFFWAIIVSEGISVAISLLAIAAGVPPTKIEIGNGTRVVKAVGGAFAIWFFWNLKDALLPA